MSEFLDKEKPLLLAWLPVLSLTLCTFVFNTSEFVPIGLLTSIGQDFGTSEAQTGWLVTDYAWVVAVMSLPLMLLAAKVECRKLMMLVVTVFVLSHIASALSTNYWFLMASRIGVACSHAVFWSIVSPLAVEVAPPRRRATALSMIVAGSSIAMIVGLPLGRVLGLYLGWRFTFLVIGVIASLALICLWRLFPSVQNKNAMALRDVPALLGKPTLLGIYILTPVIMTGNFALYSYIEPFLAQVGGMSDSGISWILVVYGAIGIVGSWIFSKLNDSFPFAFMRSAVIGIAISLLMMKAFTLNTETIVAACLFWGFSVTLYNLVFQSSIITAAPQGTAIAMSVYSGIYNIGIGTGALVGGIVVTHSSIENIGYFGGTIATIAAIFCLIYVVPAFKKLAATKAANTTKEKSA